MEGGGRRWGGGWSEVGDEAQWGGREMLAACGGRHVWLVATLATAVLRL